MPRKRNLAGLAPISLPARATARVAPTIRRIALALALALAPALAPTLALALALALAPPVRAYGPGPAGSRSRGLLYKAELLCSSN
jgi:hypothetical protein